MEAARQKTLKTLKKVNKEKNHLLQRQAKLIQLQERIQTGPTHRHLAGHTNDLA